MAKWNWQRITPLNREVSPHDILRLVTPNPKAKAPLRSQDTEGIGEQLVQIPYRPDRNEVEVSMFVLI